MNNELSLIQKFEQHVYENIIRCGLFLSQKDTAGVAVSGGADSVSLLISLAELGKVYGFSIKVVTVNHNIREENETSGDALFVERLCKDLNKNGCNVICRIFTIPKGKVLGIAEENALSIEESARNLRYEIFESFIKEESLSFLALAHNKNDQIETLLMRFLQGSNTAGMSGIRMSRDCYVRPLLDVSRSEIEEYLRLKDVIWRTDSTNFDCRYLRNRIRNKLIPFLNENFCGFETALLSGAQKSLYDEECLSKFVDKKLWHYENNNLVCERDSFFKPEKAVQLRNLQNGLILFGKKIRFPFSLLNDFITNGIEKSSYSVEFSDLKIIADQNTICIKNKELVATDLIFFAIIKEDCNLCFPFGTVHCSVDDGVARIILEWENNSLEMEKIPVPFCIRSIQSDDKVLCSNGEMKSVLDVFSAWHVGSEKKKLIPVIQELASCKQNIIAVAGCVCGFDNWIVRG